VIVAEDAVPLKTVPMDRTFAGPAAPAGPGLPASPAAPRGRTSESTWLGALPVIVAAAAVPLVTVPIDRLLAGPAGPGEPGGPWAPAPPLADAVIDAADTLAEIEPPETLAEMTEGCATATMSLTG
jgi:hypothetical protein